MIPKTMADVIAAAHQCAPLYAYLIQAMQQRSLDDDDTALLCGAVIVLADALKAQQALFEQYIATQPPVWRIVSKEPPR